MSSDAVEYMHQMIENPVVWCPLTGSRPEGNEKPMCPVFIPSLDRAVAPDFDALWKRTERAKKRSRVSLTLAIVALIFGLSGLIGGGLFLLAFKDVPAGQDSISCSQRLQSQFMAEVGHFANTPPAPSDARDAIQGRIDIISKKLDAVANGGDCNL